ncbi:hypothetical protein [Kitasatospora sp. McL0602]|uniref:hypothetical protein n=1 Tax=Kitasatospora sp. McL0602 TaxID=3439530 RepID=UPI003F8A54C9
MTTITNRLREIITEHDSLTDGWAAYLRANLRTYDPDAQARCDQPCEDWEMGDYDQLDDDRAHEDALRLDTVVNELRTILATLETAK